MDELKIIDYTSNNILNYSINQIYIKYINDIYVSHVNITIDTDIIMQNSIAINTLTYNIIDMEAIMTNVPKADMMNPSRVDVPQSDMMNPPHVDIQKSDMMNPSHVDIQKSDMMNPSHVDIQKSDMMNPPHVDIPQSDMMNPPHVDIPKADMMNPPHVYIHNKTFTNEIALFVSICSICYNCFPTNKMIYGIYYEKVYIQHEYFCIDCIENYATLHNNKILYCPLYAHLSNKLVETIYNNTMKIMLKTIAHNNYNFKICPFCNIYGYGYMYEGFQKYLYYNTIHEIYTTLPLITFADGIRYPYINENSKYKYGFIKSINNVNIKNMSYELISKLITPRMNITIVFSITSIMLLYYNNQCPIKSYKQIQKIYCRECDVIWCTKCNNIHEHHLCNYIKNPKDIVKKINDVIAEINMTRCSKCHYAYVKINTACNHLTCTNCDNFFCHICNVTLDKDKKCKCILSDYSMTKYIDKMKINMKIKQRKNNKRDILMEHIFNDNNIEMNEQILRQCIKQNVYHKKDLLINKIIISHFNSLSRIKLIKMKNY
jgi:hypothetical protein